VKPLLFVSILFLACGLSGCSSDDGGNGTGPDLIVISDLAGAWNCTEFLATSTDNPEIQFELISLGGALSVTVQENGSFVGEVSFPDPDTGQLVTLPIAGTFSLASQTRLTIDFAQEIPPLLEDETLDFTLTGNTMQLHDEVTTFDFDFDGQDEAATFDATLVR